MAFSTLSLSNSRQDTVILADVSFVRLLESLVPKLRSVREVVLLTDERRVGALAALCHAVLCHALLCCAVLCCAMLCCGLQPWRRGNTSAL